ncbi:MAG TPA: hypothetical protein VFX21_04340 [Acidimicrobiia bacterium]|nr:hypothetical protein [Acidimicrobiia bacterium]
MNRPNGNRAHDTALYVAGYRKLTDDELNTALVARNPSPSPWQREAIRKVLWERKVAKGREP